MPFANLLVSRRKSSSIQWTGITWYIKGFFSMKKNIGHLKISKFWNTIINLVNNTEGLVFHLYSYQQRRYWHEVSISSLHWEIELSVSCKLCLSLWYWRWFKRNLNLVSNYIAFRLWQRKALLLHFYSLCYNLKEEFHLKWWCFILKWVNLKSCLEI